MFSVNERSGKISLFILFRITCLVHNRRSYCMQKDFKLFAILLHCICIVHTGTCLHRVSMHAVALYRQLKGGICVAVTSSFCIHWLWHQPETLETFPCVSIVWPVMTKWYKITSMEILSYTTKTDFLPRGRHIEDSLPFFSLIHLHCSPTPSSPFTSCHLATRSRGLHSWKIFRN